MGLFHESTDGALVCSGNARMEKIISRIPAFQADLIMFQIYMKRKIHVGYLLRVPYFSTGFFYFSKVD